MKYFIIAGSQDCAYQPDEAIRGLNLNSQIVACEHQAFLCLGATLWHPKTSDRMRGYLGPNRTLTS